MNETLPTYDNKTVVTIAIVFDIINVTTYEKLSDQCKFLFLLALFWLQNQEFIHNVGSRKEERNKERKLCLTRAESQD